MDSLEIDWFQCTGAIWCELNKLDITHKYVKSITGVYILWYDVQKTEIVKVGHGKIKDELLKDRKELAIQAFAKYKVKVTWADVSKSKLEQVHAYLEDILKPTISDDNLDKTKKIEVNLPFEIKK